MKIEKRLLVVAALAVCLVAVTATVASGAVWKHNHSNLGSQVSFNVTGGEVLQTGSGGMSCEVFGTIQAQSGSTGQSKNGKSKIAPAPSATSPAVKSRRPNRQAIPGNSTSKRPTSKSQTCASAAPSKPAARSAKSTKR